MAAKFQWVPEREPDRNRLGSETEDRYRYPAPEEIWEVSCEPDRREREQKCAENRRRAS